MHPFAPCCSPASARLVLLQCFLLSLLIFDSDRWLTRVLSLLQASIQHPASVNCTSPTNWSIATTALTVSNGHRDRPLLLFDECELVTAVNSCGDPSAACWDGVIGVDLRSGQLTFNLTLPAPATVDQQYSYKDLRDSPVLSFDGQLVYWSRLVSSSNASIPCAEIVAFTHGPGGGQLRWRSEMCGANLSSTSTVTLLVFRGLYNNGADDILLQQELGVGQQLHWRSLLGSTGAVLHEEWTLPQQLSNSVYVYSAKRDDSGVFSLTLVDQPSWACSLSSDGTWQAVRNYTTQVQEGFTLWGGWTDNGAVTLQRRLVPPSLTTWRAVDLLTGSVLWTKDLDSTILRSTWMPASYPYNGASFTMLDGSADRPGLAVLQSEAMLFNSTPKLRMGVNGFVDASTGASYTTDVLPPYAPAPMLDAPSPVNYWLDAHTVASWLQWRWFVYDFPSMRVLAYGDVDLRVEYGNGTKELARFYLTSPRIVAFDRATPAVLTVYSLVDTIVGKTFSGTNYTGPPAPPASSSSSSSAAAQPSSSSMSAPSSTGNASPSSAGGWWAQSRVIVAAAVLVLLAVLSVALLCWIRRRNRSGSSASAAQPLLSP